MVYEYDINVYLCDLPSYMVGSGLSSLNVSLVLSNDRALVFPDVQKELCYNMSQLADNLNDYDVLSIIEIMPTFFGSINLTRNSSWKIIEAETAFNPEEIDHMD